MIQTKVIRGSNLSDFNITWDSREKWTKTPYLSFEADEYEERLSKIRSAMDEDGLECLIIHGSPNHTDGNLRYVSGFESSYGNSFLIIIPDKDPVLLTNSIPYENPMHGQLFQTWIKEVKFGQNNTEESENILAENILKVIVESGKPINTIGVASKRFFPAVILDILRSRLTSVKFGFVDKTLRRIQAIKTQKEIESCIVACNIIDAGMETALSLIKPGITELEIAAKAMSTIIEGGGQNTLSVSPITCVSGPYSSFRDVYPTNRKLELGDMVCIGLGCNYNGYQVSIYRSTTVGTPNEQQKKILDAALNIQEAITGTIQFGVKIGDLLEIQKTMLSNSGLEQRENSFLGHGIGTDEFGEPTLIRGVSNVDDEIQEGMLLAIGPSISLLGVGTACFQDIVYIDDKTHQILTKTKRRTW